jgi:hypothetical protein
MGTTIVKAVTAFRDAMIVGDHTAGREGFDVKPGHIYAVLDKAFN